MSDDGMGLVGAAMLAAFGSSVTSAEGPFVHTFTPRPELFERFGELEDAAFEAWMLDPTDEDFADWLDLAEVRFGIVHQHIERWERVP